MKKHLKYFEYTKNMFATFGVVAVLAVFYSMKSEKIKISFGSEDRQTAVQMINAYKEKAPNVAVRGYFLSNDAISRLQKSPKHNGIYIYPAFDKSTSRFSIVAEGGACAKPAYRVSSTEPVFVIGDTYCPPDCGSF